MTAIVRNAETSRISLGDVLRTIAGLEVELVDASGREIGRIVLEAAQSRIPGITGRASRES